MYMVFVPNLHLLKLVLSAIPVSTVLECLTQDNPFIKLSLPIHSLYFLANYEELVQVGLVAGFSPSHDNL